MDMDGISDDDEEDPGKQLWVDGPLAQISLSYEPEELYPGYIELKVPSATAIRVWEDAEKTSLVIPDGPNNYKRWFVGTNPTTLYVEGYSSATSVALWLSYSSSMNPEAPLYPGCENHKTDVVKFNVNNICYYVPPEAYDYWFCWQSFIPGFSCPPDPGETNQVALPDDCGNHIAIFCDTTNSGGFLAYSWWYIPVGQPFRGTEIGLCIWEGGQNKFEYKVSQKSKYGKERFLETRHSTKNDNKGSWYNQEGCPGYWCWKVQEYNCVSGVFSAESPIWRKDNTVFYYGWWAGEGIPCTGPPYAHPTW